MMLEFTPLLAAYNLRLDARAFRENTVYDSEGDPIRLLANAQRMEAGADAIEAILGTLHKCASFIEALADNDPDEPIADNGMTVLGKLQFDAPALAMEVRALLAGKDRDDGTA